MKEDENNDLTESLNNMIDSKNVDNIRLATSIIVNQPDIVAKDQLKSHWYDINSLIDKNTVKYSELYNSDERSDKVYILILEKQGITNYKVVAHYGRRGKSLRKDIKTQNAALSQAKLTYKIVLREKIEKKNYTLINDNNEREF